MVLKNLEHRMNELQWIIEIKELECGEFDSLFATVEFMIIEGRYDLANKVLDIISEDVVAKRIANGE